MDLYPLDMFTTHIRVTCKPGDFQINRQKKKTWRLYLNQGMFFFQNSNYIILTIELPLHIVLFLDYSFHARQERNVVSRLCYRLEDDHPGRTCMAPGSRSSLSLELVKPHPKHEVRFTLGSWLRQSRLSPKACVAKLEDGQAGHGAGF